MDVREKLVELVNDVLMYLPWGEIQKDTAERIVDRMMDHDVTVQERIPVDERMPDACGFPCLLCGENSFGQIRVFEGFTGYMERGKLEWHSNQKDIDIDVWTITHWMPLPQPPKGE